MSMKLIQELLEIQLKKADNEASLDAFMKEFYENTEAHPFARHLNLWGGDKLIGIEASKFDGKISLQAIMSFAEKNKGNASAALKWFTDLADKHKVDIELSVKPIANAGAKEGKNLNKAQLTAWYKRYGFEKSGGEYMLRKHK